VFCVLLYEACGKGKAMPPLGGTLELDREIRREDVQMLSSRDQVAALFAALGYQTDSRLTPEEVQLLRTTAPPRDPLALAEGACSG
jgi:hypothetical protein